MPRHTKISTASRAALAWIPPGPAALLVLSSQCAQAQSPAMPAAPAAATTTQADAPLTLQRAIAMAMASNADLSAARHALQAAEGQVLQGQARPNPELSLLLEDTQRNTRSTTLQINQAFE